jgi:hypothetical protein
VHVSLSRARARSLTVLLAMVVVALAAAIATPMAKGGTAPTWYYDEGMAGTPPFSFVAPLDPLLLTVSGDSDQSLAFQVTDAAIAALPSGDQNDNQIMVSATTSQIDLPMAQGSGTLKDFLTLGGDLATVRGVSVALFYNIDGRTVGGDLQWTFAGNGSPGGFTLELPAYAGGHTIAYQIRFVAPATVMTAPVVLDDVVIGYGPYVKPPPAKGGGGTGNNKGKSGGDKGKPAANTGRGSGSGSGAGSTTDNGSGTGGSGTSGSDVKQSTSATSGAGSQPAPAVHKASSKVRSARAATDAPVTSPATGGSMVVQGYAVVASAASGAGGAAVATASAAAGGGRSVGGGAGFGVGDTYLVFGAAIVGLLLLPVPFVARRLRRVADYDHVAAAGSWYADAVR